MNQAIIVGNLTRDPELSQTSSGVSYCKFSVAVNREYPDSNGEQITDFFNVVCWKGTAEACAKCLQKGSKVLVRAEMHPKSYEKDGEKRYSFELSATKVEFLGRPSSNQPEKEEVKQEKMPSSKPVIEDIDDGLPF